MSDSKKYGKQFGVDMPQDEAMERIAKATKEETAGRKAKGELIEEGEAQVALFRGTQVRQVFHNGEWFFSIVDVIEAVTETDRPRRYWSDLKRQLSEDEGFSELYENIVQLKMPSADGKKYATDAVNVETLFRIVQSIPSKKAEPFKRWLAKVGYERIEEIQNPEIGVKRAILQWQIEGRTDDWIDARIRSIVTRKELTLEWKNRGIRDEQYGTLTKIISVKTFDMDPAAHKKLKGLTTQNLRDHMTDLELIFTMLGEKSTTAIAISTRAQGMVPNMEAAAAGGKVAGDARKELEKKLNKPVATSANFLKGAGRTNDPELLTKKKRPDSN
jgi:DNA-damage-inducible protein D